MTPDERKSGAIALLQHSTEDQALAFGELRRASRAGDRDCLSRIAGCYYLGVGCMQNSEAAFRHATKRLSASDSTSDPLALYICGACYERGEGVAQDREKAAKFFARSAQGGFRLAKYSLAECYASGFGVPQDMTMARTIARQAALDGDRAAMTFIGQMCLEGIGGASEGDEAIMWFQRAADAGDPLGMHNFALCCLQGAGVPKDLKKAQSLYEAAASWGWIPAMCALSAFFKNHPELPDAEMFSMFWMKAAFDEDEEFADAICYSKPERGTLERRARILLHRMHEYTELFGIITEPPK